MFIKNMIFLIFFLSFVCSSYAFDEKSSEIMKKVFASGKGNNLTSEMEVILIDNNNEETKLRIKYFAKDEAKDSKRILFIQSPELLKGTGFLSNDYADTNKTDEMWIFLPAMKKAKTITSNDKSKSFLGSDLNFSDIAADNLNDFNFNLIKETEIDGQKVWAIESIPKNQTVIDQTGYKKALNFIRQDNYFVVRSIKLTKDGDTKYIEAKKIKKIDGAWFSTEVIINRKHDNKLIHKTIIKTIDIKLKQIFPSDFFTVSHLEEGNVN